MKTMKLNIRGEAEVLQNEDEMNDKMKEVHDSREIFDEHKEKNILEKEKLDRVLTVLRRKHLEKQGYRFVGNHSAIKVCEYTHKMIKGQDVCYKCTFYGINSHRCIQMSPVMNTCNLRCKWCWRDIEFTSPKWVGPVDDPEFIVEESIKAHVHFLIGYKGNSQISSQIIKQVMMPKHVAISLFGEATNYPKLPELVKEFHKKGITTFLVTNGTNPEMMQRLLEEQQPTQLYITLPAPDESTFMEACRPLLKDAWWRILQSVKLLNNFSCRKTIRFTLANKLNMQNIEGYAKILDGVDVDYYELKGYVHIGHSQHRLLIEQQPSHEEIKNFALELAKHTGLKIVSEKAESRAILMMREENKTRLLTADPDRVPADVYFVK